LAIRDVVRSLTLQEFVVEGLALTDVTVDPNAILGAGRLILSGLVCWIGD
jgi:hypothetical protein